MDKKGYNADWAALNWVKSLKKLSSLIHPLSFPVKWKPLEPAISTLSLQNICWAETHEQKPVISDAEEWTLYVLQGSTLTFSIDTLVHLTFSFWCTSKKFRCTPIFTVLILSSSLLIITHGHGWLFKSWSIRVWSFYCERLSNIFSLMLKTKRLTGKVIKMLGICHETWAQTREPIANRLSNKLPAVLVWLLCCNQEADRLLPKWLKKDFFFAIYSSNKAPLGV